MDKYNPEDHIGHTLEIIRDDNQLTLECKTCQCKLNQYNTDDMPTCITSISKGDLLQYFKTPWIQAAIREMTRIDMQYLARKMADDYCEQLFHESAKLIFEERILPTLSLPDGYGRCELCSETKPSGELSPDANACCSCSRELHEENPDISLTFNIWTGKISKASEKSVQDIDTPGYIMVETNQFPVYGHDHRYIGMFFDDEFLDLDTIDDMFHESMGNIEPDLAAKQPNITVNNHKFHVYSGEASIISHDDYIDEKELKPGYFFLENHQFPVFLYNKKYIGLVTNGQFFSTEKLKALFSDMNKGIGDSASPRL